VVDEGRRARDLRLLDAIDAFRREAIDIDVWRLVRDGRDPRLGSASRSRWCNGAFDVLYTSFERDGAIAEINSLLSLQPVVPSKDRWLAYRLKVAAANTLRLADLDTLAAQGVDAARYKEREYGRTQEIADAAFFLGFDGLIVPSARWLCLNFVLFTDRIAPDQVQIVETPDAPVKWEDWRKRTGR
jgi:RES domain-containing protein